MALLQMVQKHFNTFRTSRLGKPKRTLPVRGSTYRTGLSEFRLDKLFEEGPFDKRLWARGGESMTKADPKPTALTIEKRTVASSSSHLQSR
jgi:hypothetical protein